MHIVKYMLYVIQFSITCTLCIIEICIVVPKLRLYLPLHVDVYITIYHIRTNINTSVFRMLSYLHINKNQDVHSLPNLERGNAAFRLRLKKVNSGIKFFVDLNVIMVSGEDHRSSVFIRRRPQIGFAEFESWETRSHAADDIGRVHTLSRKWILGIECWSDSQSASLTFFVGVIPIVYG